MDSDREKQFERFKFALKILTGIDIDAHGGGTAACKLLGIKPARLTNWRTLGPSRKALDIAAQKARINPAYILGHSEAMALTLKPIENKPLPPSRPNSMRNDRSIKNARKR